MPSANWQRVGALCGIGAVVLIAAHAMLGDPYDPATDPNPTQPAALLAQALVNNREQARLGAYLGLAGAFLLIWFAGYLRHYLQRAGDDDGWLAPVAYGGGVVTTSLLLVSVGFAFAASELATYGDDTQVAKAYFIYGWNAAALLAPPLGAMVAATIAAGFRYGAFPRWFNWFGVLIAVALAAVLFTNMVGLGAMISLLWLGLLSIVLFVQSWQAPRAAEDKATACAP